MDVVMNPVFSLLLKEHVGKLEDPFFVHRKSLETPFCNLTGLYLSI